MKSESVKMLGTCPQCEAAGRVFDNGAGVVKARRLLLRGGRPFCLFCGYLD